MHANASNHDSIPPARSAAVVFTPMTAMDASSSFPGSTSSFVILSVSIAGMLSIALLLLAYYLFLTRCGLLFFRRPDDLHDHHRISVSLVNVQDHEPPRRSRRGLEEAAIRRIPTFRYPLVVLPEEVEAASSSECAVCLADFRHGERLRLLPHCRHAFHIDCIDAWLQDAASCPICRAPALQLHPTSNNYHLLHIPRATTDDITSLSSPADAEAQQPARSSSRFLPMRRSLSMDSTDKRFYLALQRILQQHSGSPPAAREEEDGKGDSAGADTDGRSSRRLRRSFFSFSQSRGSRSGSAILPL
ncbi:hypothetical protein GQ55_6G293300 [Panicum hallii var. hallii]|uniref:RING-type E3 ubiquitin transferase n=1 Tax=Panicum hallii var. hallii TaxID=1504633 RepID=A0A2T7DAY4_9POAL|nr:hypothetical protein GQ55_6G293300 [Panicum hallii var. hallii]